MELFIESLKVRYEFLTIVKIKAECTSETLVSYNRRHKPEELYLNS